MSISTVTPCHGRVELVEKLLSSLQANRQAYQGQSETIIIDSSSIEESQRIKQVCAQFGAVYLRGPLSVREKRNLGVRSATHEIVAFIDSDCEAEPDWLGQHAEQYRLSPHISGVLGPVQFRGRRSWVWQVLKFTNLLDSFSFAEKYPYAMWGPTANLSLKKDAIEQAGFFRTELPFRLGGDDLDLTLRITEAGHYIKCCPTATVWHTTDTWNSLGSVLDRTWRWGRMGYHILRLHPKLSYTDLPKPLIQFILWLFLGIFIALSKGNFWFASLPFVWGLVFFIVSLIIDARKQSTLPDHYLAIAQGLKILNEIAAACEFILHGKFTFITRRMVFSTTELLDDWESLVMRQWLIIFTNGAIFAFALLLLWLSGKGGS